MRTADLLSALNRPSSASDVGVCADADPAMVTKTANIKDASAPKRECVVLIFPPRNW